MATIDLFLRADELDELCRRAEGLELLDSEAVHKVREVVRQWSDPQAVANLLMYPAVIPDDLRREALLKGLNHLEDSYTLLAAVVGLQKVGGELADEDRTAIVGRLIQVIKTAPPTTAARATVTLNEISRVEDAEGLVELLDRDLGIVRHNTLVALIETAGLPNVRPLVNSAFIAGRLTREGKAYADAQLIEAEAYLKDGKLDEAWYASDLSAPLLAYIPNLKDYHEG